MEISNFDFLFTLWNYLSLVSTTIAAVVKFVRTVTRPHVEPKHSSASYLKELDWPEIMFKCQLFLKILKLVTNQPLGTVQKLINFKGEWKICFCNSYREILWFKISASAQIPKQIRFVFVVFTILKCICCCFLFCFVLHFIEFFVLYVVQMSLSSKKNAVVIWPKKSNRLSKKFKAVELCRSIVAQKLLFFF